MLPAAGLLALALLLLVAVVAPRLAVAAFPSRAPYAAVALWQAIGLSAGLLALEVCFTVALAPLGSTHLAAMRVLLRRRSLPPLPWWAWLAAVAGLVALGRLTWVTAVSTARTVRARRRNRVVLDLVATRNPLLRGTHIVEHDVPVAYCLPGMRPRVVLSRGTVTALAEDEVRAVLDHELAHVVQRHDLVVLPFLALGATFPWLPVVRRAQQQVFLLVEILADDRATRRHDPMVLARALCTVGGGRAPAGGFGAGGSGLGGSGTSRVGRGRLGVGPFGAGRFGVGPFGGGRFDGGRFGANRSATVASSDGGTELLLRTRRLLSPPQPLGPLGVALVSGSAVVVALLPVVGLLLPLMPPL